ncbi:MAG TPA: alpha/beta fold hydrolase [Candidatus Paceibacterota bacterium]|nr:alpha/beta fold hydrolase [Candidatus Paceibacterota bacterium]
MAITDAPAGLLEDFAVRGSGPEGKIGILLVHGFTGSPASMRSWAEFFAARGYTVRVPRLPGHGTEWQDLNKIHWQEWPAKVVEELDELGKTCEKVFIFGLSMGGGTSLYVAAHHNDRLTGIVLVNPMIHIPGASVKFAPILSLFRSHLPSVGNDIKRPGVSEWAYDALPTKGIVQLNKLLKSSRSTLGQIKIPLLLFHSAEDHLLPVSNTEIVMAEIGAPRKQRVELLNSYHVATVDYDCDLIFENSLIFVQELSAKS